MIQLKEPDRAVIVCQHSQGVALIVNWNRLSCQSGVIVVVIDKSGSKELLLELHYIPRPSSVWTKDNELVGEAVEGQQKVGSGSVHRVKYVATMAGKVEERKKVLQLL